MAVFLTCPLLGQIDLGNPTKVAASSLGITFPQGITYHPGRDSLFVWDDLGRVTELDSVGRRLGSFQLPVFGGGDIAWDPFSSRLLVSHGATVYSVSTDGVGFSVFLDLSVISATIEGLAVDPMSGHVWIADDRLETVTELDRSGSVVSDFSTRSVALGFREPVGLTFFGQDLLVVDDLDGTHSLYFLSTSGALLQPSIDIGKFGVNDPEGVAVAAGAKLWICGDNDDALLSLDILSTQQAGSILDFAHFGEGAGLLFSQIMLLNLSQSQDAPAQVLLRDPQGQPLRVDLNGQTVEGGLGVNVPAGGSVILRTDGLGPIVQGSVVVEADQPLGGVILFGGAVGVAGVGSSPHLSAGFVAPMENRAAAQVRVGIALVNLEQHAIGMTFQLFSEEGVLLQTRSDLTLVAGGQSAQFLDQLFPELDLSDFQGVLKVTADGTITATVIQTRPGEFVTMPVAPIGAGETELHYAQFGEGAGLLFSQIMLINGDPTADASALLHLRDPHGQPLQVDLNGQQVLGQLQTTVPASGIRILQTDGLGLIVQGSVTVLSDIPLSGVILFGGPSGVAGVGTSQPLLSGFRAPMENNVEKAIRVGVAVMNLENKPVSATLKLINSDGTLLATRPGVILPALGQTAQFLDQLFSVDLSDFTGVLELTANGRTAATVIQTRPEQFATMPVVAQ